MLDGSDHLLPEEKDMVVQAIEDHSGGSNISSAVGAALLFADKADFSRKRYLPFVIIEKQPINNLEIVDMEIYASNKVIIVNAATTDAFSMDTFVSEYRKYPTLSRAAECLGCTCQVLLNGEEVMFG